MIRLPAMVPNIISQTLSNIFRRNINEVSVTPSTQQSITDFHSSDSSQDSFGTSCSIVSGTDITEIALVPNIVCTSIRNRLRDNCTPDDSQMEADDCSTSREFDRLSHESYEIIEDNTAGTEPSPRHVTSNEYTVPVDNVPSSDDCVRVSIICGKHKGKTGILKKFTEKRAQIVIDGTCKTIYLIPEHIQILKSARELDQRQIVGSQQNDTNERMEVPNESATASDSVNNCTKDALEDRNESQDVLPVEPNKGCKVSFVGGTYKGQYGTFVCFTNKLTKVIVDGASKSVCLHRKNVKFDSRVATNNNVTENRISLHVTAPNTTNRKSERNVRFAAANSTKALSSSYFSSILGNETGNSYTRIGLRVEFCKLLTDDQVAQREQSIAYYWFRNRLATYKIELTNASCHLPHRYVENDECVYELLATKVLDKNKCSEKGRQYECKSEYVRISDQSCQINLQQILEDIADFGVLTPQKAAARMQLLLSTCSKNDGKNCIFDEMSSEDFEMIEECSNEGCGFIPRTYIDKFFGSPSKNFAIQVRVFAPKLGIFKGMLMEKPGITKIQLPKSMLKVPQSRNDPTLDWAVVLITSNGIVPSKTNRAIDDESFGHIEPKFGKMMWHVLNDLGVEQGIIDAYLLRWKKHSEKLCHTSVVGLADPTNAIPYNSVFVTGMSKLKSLGNRIFVSRYPCTNKMDGRLIRIVTDKPPFMSDEYYQWLQELPVGGIIFGNARPGQRPLPSMIADGDLDGDNYFICWEPSIISHLDLTIDNHVVDDLNHTIQKSVSCSSQEYNNDWFRLAQKVLGDVQTISQQQKLIGNLYGIWQTLLKDNKHEHDINAAGIAYKQAIDIQKHGGRVNLPKKLWHKVDSNFQHMLIDLKK